MSEPAPRTLSVDRYVEGVLAGDRAVLARAITLIESRRPSHQRLAAEVLTALMPATGRAHRLGVTGVPGVGKSTFIDSLGMYLLGLGQKVAVLAIDPTSVRSGGSILGDKTRMERLSKETRAFIRPSPTSGTLGGVARKTRETMLLCEAAGFDTILVETVGIGQSGLVVAEMTDFFLVLMLAGAGDELQGIKRGLMELADAVAVNKADGDNANRARSAASTYRSAIRLLHGTEGVWRPRVTTCSALHDEGIDAIWKMMMEHQQLTRDSGDWELRRRGQQLRWFHTLVDESLRQRLERDAVVAAALPSIEAAVQDGTLPPTIAADQVLELFQSGRSDDDG